MFFHKKIDLFLSYFVDFCNNAKRNYKFYRFAFQKIVLWYRKILLTFCVNDTIIITCCIITISLDNWPRTKERGIEQRWKEHYPPYSLWHWDYLRCRDAICCATMSGKVQPAPPLKPVPFAKRPLESRWHTHGWAQPAPMRSIARRAVRQRAWRWDTFG